MSEATFALLVAVIGATAVVVVTWLICYFVYKAKLLEREERRLMIERGMMPPPEAPPNRGWPGVKQREMELKAEERRLRIEKGLDVTATQPEDKLPEDYLRRGLIALGLGAGIAVGYAVFLNSGFDVSSEEMRNWMLFFAVISPVLGLYGVANVVYYKMTKWREASGATARDQVR